MAETIKNPKEIITPQTGSDASAGNPLSSEYHNIANDSSGIVKGNSPGEPATYVEANFNGKSGKAFQTTDANGNVHLNFEGKDYVQQAGSEKGGSQTWVSTDGSSSMLTQERGGRTSDTGSAGTVPAATGGDSSTAQPVSDTKVLTTTPSVEAKPESAIPSANTGGDTKVEDAKPQPITPEAPVKTGGEVPVTQPEQGKGTPSTDAGKTPGGDKTTEPIKGEPVKGGEEGGRSGQSERGSERGERGEAGGGSGGSEKGGGERAERGDSKGGDNKLSIPEKPVEKPSGGEAGQEKSPLEKIDLSKPEARRELFEALKSAREILDGKADLKSIDPNKRALVEELIKLDQNRSDKLFNMLSAEFQGKGTGMSDSAYQFNLRTLLGLEKVANPTQPNTRIPGLTPELANSLHNLFKMYSGEGQNPQRSMMLAEAYKFSVDYNAKMGLDKEGLTSRDVLVALNSMSKDFADLSKQASPFLATKDTFAQLAGKQDMKEMANLTPEQAAKMKEMAAMQATDQQHGAKLPEGAIKIPAQDVSAVGKVEGQLVKDLGAKDALAQQQAAEQAASATKNQPNQLGQKDPLTAEQKELAERELGTKKKPEDDKEEAARRMAMEAALAAAAMGGRAASADITESKEEEDEENKKDDEKDARRQYKTKQGDTLEMIAETQLKSKTAATLLYNMNSNRIPTRVMGKLYIVSMRPDMELVLPSPNEVKLFKGPYLQFQYREFGSAEDELAFWQKFIAGQEPGHSSLFDKFGIGQNPGSGAVAGLDDNFAAEAFTVSQRQNIRTQLGMESKESKESVSQTAKTVRYGESIRKFAARNLHDESLWELIARKNNLSVVEDNSGEKTVRLKSYQKLVMPTASEIKEYKQVQSGGSSTSQTFEMVSQECPKCRRLVRQNESVCPPPCFYAFVDSSAAEGADEKAEVKEEQSQGRVIRRRRTTGFVADREPTPSETPSKPYEDEVVNTVLKAAGLSSATAAEVPLVKSKLPLTTPGEIAYNPSRRGVKIQDLDPVCRVVLTPKDREGRKFERKLEVLKDGNWVVAVVYEIGAQESFVTEFDTTGAPRKQRIDLPFEPAMELSENHLGEAWKEYRQQFLGE